MNAMNDAGIDVMIGQMILSGFRGTTLEPANPIIGNIVEQHVGGIILFDYDVARDRPVMNIAGPDQLRTLTGALQKHAAGDLLIGIDQEGGTVDRLKEERGFPPTLSAQKLGIRNDLALTRNYAERTAKALADAGITINFAPAVDLLREPDNPIIGKRERSYSADPQIVTAHALEVIAAHHHHGVLTTLKHFPGHGSSLHDTHRQFVDVTQSWHDDELIPYREIVSRGLCDAVMTSHVYHRALDPDYPATLSKNIITGILRDDLGFDGVIFSDDMQMRAIVDHFDLETAIFRAIEAGIDILSFGNNMSFDPDIVTKAAAVVHRLVDGGRTSMDRIVQSFNRVVKLKKHRASLLAAALERAS